MTLLKSENVTELFFEIVEEFLTPDFSKEDWLLTLKLATEGDPIAATIFYEKFKSQVEPYLTGELRRKLLKGISVGENK